MLVAIVSLIFGKSFSKESRITIMIMVGLASLLYEIFISAMNFILLESSYEIVQIVKMISIEAIYNVILVTILYPIFQRIGPWIENEYKGSKILTRYF